MNNHLKITVIGAGSWGTALAILLAEKGYPVSLWGHNKNHINGLIKERENKKFIPGRTFPPNLFPQENLQFAVDSAKIIVMAIPSHSLRSCYQDIVPFLQDGCKVISAIKGIENETFLTMSQVMGELTEIQKEIEIGVLSGPSFAIEVARKVPTAVTIGFTNIETAKQMQKVFGNSYFRVYASSDVIGLEISAAIKNIIAIAAGVCDGLGYGLNTRAALITRGLSEMRKLGVALQADEATFFGLSGLGDLVLTCTGDLSRNRAVGIKLGQGQKLAQIMEEMSMVAEGVKTTKSVYELSQKLNIEMPILEQIYLILYKNKSCSEAVGALLQRDLKIE